MAMRKAFRGGTAVLYALRGVGRRFDAGLDVPFTGRGDIVVKLV